MSNLYSKSSVKLFFHEILKILRNTDKNVVEVWQELSEIEFLKRLSKFELYDFLMNFDFIDITKGNYINYVSINKILFIMIALKHLELDIKVLSEILDYNGFEALIQEILLRNDYKAIKNFRFTDRSNFKSTTSQKRYEIDVIAMRQKYVLIIDAKQWKRKDSFNSINKAANLQLQRVIALKKNPEAFSKLVQELLGIDPNLNKYLPFKLIPLMVTLEDNGIRINDNQIPLVSISQFNAFLQEFQIYLDYYNIIEIKKVFIQKQLV